MLLLVIDFFGYGTVFRIGKCLLATEEGFLGKSYSTFLIDFITLFYQGFSVGFDLLKQLIRLLKALFCSNLSNLFTIMRAESSLTTVEMSSTVNASRILLSG
jgi:ABC-type thiamin/hydroxymethylpyrimidine transport system permease subunit